MIVQYGTYNFPVGTCGLSVNQRVREAARGLPFLVDTTVSVTGRIFNQSGDAFDLDAKMARMERAFAKTGADFGLLHDDGTRTNSYWLNRDSIGGIQVRSLGWPNYKGMERVSYVTFQIEMSGLFILPVGPPDYLEFTESISIEGGGPRFAVREVHYGPPIRQRTRTHTKCVATQVGSATGFDDYPKLSPPPPIWPHALVSTMPDLQLTGPRSIGDPRSSRQTEHKIAWRYQYEWVDRLLGVPHFAY